METVPKPDELLALDAVTAEMFDTLRRWFGVPDTVSLDLRSVDSAVEELGDPQLIAAMAMRKLQALNLLATPGVRTSTDVVVSIIQDLERALLQAPAMRLKLQAETTDWDAAFVQLTSLDEDEVDTPPEEADDDDVETSRFRELHGQLHDALFAVLHVTDGEIRYLI